MLIIITIITFTFSALTLILGNVKSLAQNHTPRKWQSQNFTPVFLPSLAHYAPFMASRVSSFVGLGIGLPFLPPPAHHKSIRSGEFSNSGSYSGERCSCLRTFLQLLPQLSKLSCPQLSPRHSPFWTKLKPYFLRKPFLTPNFLPTPPN